jgi:hypothetical protein
MRNTTLAAGPLPERHYPAIHRRDDKIGQAMSKVLDFNDFSGNELVS